MANPLPSLIVTGAELTPAQIIDLLSLAKKCKANRLAYKKALANKVLAMCFDKQSLRTKFSFTVAMHELGGLAIESLSQDRKFEEPEDFIRALQGYVHGLVLRTYDEKAFYRMNREANIPIINGLSDNYHPCQILADLMTLQENFKQLSGLKLAYVGDGNNMLHTLLLMAPKMGITVHYACPKNHQPEPEIVADAIKSYSSNMIVKFEHPKDAVAGVNAVYTDVWTSMGFEKRNSTDFKGFQVNEDLMAYADKESIFMHCLPMERGEEISRTLPDQPYSAIFQQAENRLHVQKALLLGLMRGK